MADGKKAGDPAIPDNSNSNNSAVVTPAEFAKIPLDFIIATPLLTVIEAHKAAASTTVRPLLVRPNVV